jgi:pyruvate/2-oxoglutarate dehydrogenase complex dihydrolipoamide dehydrogenase (E3) component
MTHYDFDMGVIGGGSAGLTVTAGAAQLGAGTLLVEKEKELGGDCLHFGCIPSKTLIKTAHVYHYMKNAAKYGLPAVDLPPVDFQQVAKRIQSVISAVQEQDSMERFCRLGAKVVIGHPRFVDEHTIRLEGKTYSARNWTIATGSSPAIPPIAGLNQTPFLTNREIYSLDHLPKSMIIIGAGPIGTEMAQAFCRLGTKVSIVQRSGQILKREDRDMADELGTVLSAEGVVFHLNVSVMDTRDLGTEKEVVIKNSEGKEIRLRAETILVAAGRKANLGGLDLDGIGIEFDGKGVKPDSRLRTCHKHIYAAGDVTGTYQFTHAAGYEGGIVISNAIFHLPRKVDYTFLPWCTYTDPELASIGMNEKRADAAGINYSVWTEHFRYNDRSLAEGERTGKIKMILDEKEKLLGIQILGPHAGELLGEWVPVLNGKVKLSTLALAVHPYPTLGEINKKVARTFLSSKIFSGTVKKGLRFFFHLKGRACETR